MFVFGYINICYFIDKGRCRESSFKIKRKLKDGEREEESEDGGKWDERSRERGYEREWGFRCWGFFREVV